MPEQPPNPVQPTEFTLALSFLREDVQDIRQDMRQRHEHSDQTNGRIDGLAKQLDSRYVRLMAMLIACTSILVTTMARPSLWSSFLLANLCKAGLFNYSGDLPEKVV